MQRLPSSGRNIYSDMKNIRLKDIAIVTSGNSAPQNDKMFEDGIYPFVRTSDVGRVHLSASFTKPEDYLNETGIKGMKLFPKDSILFPKSGASTLLNHRVLLGEDSYVVSHLAVIVPDKSKVVPLYLYYYTTRIDAGELVNDRAYPSLKTSILEQVSLNLPSLAEQERIVAELDLLAGIIDKQKAQLKELDNLAQSIFYDMFGNPVKNENGWEECEIISVCDTLFAGGDKPKDFSEDKDNYYKYPIIGNGDGERGVLGYSKSYRVDRAAVTIGARGASIGNCRICKPFFTPVIRLITLIPNKRVNLSYLYAISKRLSFNINGAGQAQLTIPNVANKLIPVPPRELQDEYSEKIESIESQKAFINQSIAETQKLFDYTMDKYFG